MHGPRDGKNAHLPADPEENIIQEEKGGGSRAELRAVGGIPCLGEETRYEDVADTLPCSAPHHELPTARALDEHEASEREYEVGERIACS